MQLLAEVGDVVVGDLGRMNVVLHGVVFRGQAKCIIADGEEHIVALHPLFPADDVHGREGTGVAHMESLSGGIGELNEAIELLPGLVPGDCGERLLLQPLLLPFLLNGGKIVLHSFLLINGMGIQKTPPTRRSGALPRDTTLIQLPVARPALSDLNDPAGNGAAVPPY